MKNDGGQAFPVCYFTGELTITKHGMSLRAWLAGMALNGLIGEHIHMGHEGLQGAVSDAIAAADLMLEGLKEQSSAKASDKSTP